MPNLSYRILPDDLGLEPPLTTGGAVLDTPIRKRLNHRWLAGTVLTGLAGSGLMIFSVLGALAPYNKPAAAPILSNLRETQSGLTATGTIATLEEKLVRKANLVAARQDYRIPVQVRNGAVEVTRQAGFIRLSTALATETLGFSDQVPRYNLAKLVSLASEDRAAGEGDIATGQDSEVALSLREIPSSGGAADSGLRMRDEDAYIQVLDLVTERRRDSVRPGAQALLAKIMRAPSEGSTSLAFTSGIGDPFSKLLVRMVPQNVSVIPRQDAVLAPFPIVEKVVVTKDLASVTQSLRAAKATPKQINEIIAALTRNGKANSLDGNRVLKLTQQPLEPGGDKELMRVELYFDENLIASTGRRDDGTFWPIEARDIPVRKTADKSAKSVEAKSADEDDGDEEIDSSRLSLYASIYETTRRYEIAPAIADEIIRTVFFDVDLQRRVNPGDSLEILIANGEGEGARQDLLLVSLNHAGNKRRYYRYKLEEDEIVDYFDEQGRSVKQFLLRKPIDGGELRSGFGYRRHPILGFSRLHSGVDWADRVGTPIRAAGNGVVRLAEWDSGYGRRVEIEHNHGYVTTYNHMSAFGPGISPGAKVRQGQIVGRLGSSGLSTGPHLHYEVYIKSPDGSERPVDPLAIRLPKGRELSGSRLAEFKKDVEFVENALKQAPGANAVVARN